VTVFGYNLTVNDHVDQVLIIGI